MLSQYTNNVFNSNSEEPYRAARDNQGTWRILFSWHPDLVNFSPDDEIPDDHPAVTVISDGAFVALMKEAVVQGYRLNGLNNMNETTSSSGETEDSLLQAWEELDSLKKENLSLKEELENNNIDSEKLKLAQKKLELMDKAISLGRTETDVFQTISRVGGNVDV